MVASGSYAKTPKTNANTGNKFKIAGLLAPRELP
jgi:hypothetical protein